MIDEVAVLDSDVLSLLSRGEARVVRWASAYLERHGRLTITSVTVFERLRGYHVALRAGKPYHAQMRSFQALVASCVVLPFDTAAATTAARIWAALRGRQASLLGDVLIAGIASSCGRPLLTRNVRDFQPMSAVDGVDLRLIHGAGHRLRHDPRAVAFLLGWMDRQAGL